VLSAILPLPATVPTEDTFSSHPFRVFFSQLTHFAWTYIPLMLSKSNHQWNGPGQKRLGHITHDNQDGHRLSNELPSFHPILLEIRPVKSIEKNGYQQQEIHFIGRQEISRLRHSSK
jgi:hypothetical protein